MVRRSASRGRQRALISLGLELPPLEPGLPGDPGLFGPGSIVWRVGRERLLLLGGPAAILLQLAHPLVAAGVADHSAFSADPFRRLQATLDATLRITFGDREQARDAAESVGRVHAGVSGVLQEPVGSYPRGTPYDARAPELALWVHATLVTSALRVYNRFVQRLAPREPERYYAEVKPFARLFGAGDDVLPVDYRAFRVYVADMLQGGGLKVGSDARRLAGEILHPAVPLAARPAVPAVHAVTAWLLPPRLREEFGISWRAGRKALLAGLDPLSRVGVRALPRRLRYWPHYGAALDRIARTGTN